MSAATSTLIVQKLKNGLIVSCQASASSPLNRAGIIAALALVAEQQGAVGVRIDGSRNIRAVRRAVKIPIVGIEKQQALNSPVYITPTFESVRRVCRAGAEIVALDCTRRRRPQGQSLAAIMERTRREFPVTLMADVATLDEGLAAADLGADLISTTLHGYTEDSPDGREPAFHLLESLVRKTRVPIILEGRVQTPEQLRRAFGSGAHAVVVGTAITGVDWLIRRFVEATPRAKRRAHTA